MTSKTCSTLARLSRMPLAAVATAAMLLAANSSHAITPASLAQAPLFLVTSATPQVMLNLSNDHQLYFKAYDDYSDLDDDGTAERTYKHSVDYYGYFDSYKCYDYSSTNNRFEPQAKTTDKYCNGVSGSWSGNFLNWATMTRMDTIRKMLYGGYRSTDTSSLTVLERSFLPTDAHSFVKFFDDTSQLGKLTPYSSAISICNTTYASSGNSKDTTAPPLMRIAQGDYSLWTAHEGQQCLWSEEGTPSNGNNSSITGLSAATTPPSKYATGSAELQAKVQVCVSGLAEENCENYPSGTRKPTGLLQKYGSQGDIEFGLLTGSYQKNKSGGVLRKNVSSFANELNANTGIFTGASGIVETLNKLRLTRYDYASHQYNALDSCTFGQFGFNDGQCSNWGNPQSEIYLESLRYFAGKTVTSAFNADDSAYINALGRATWSDPLDNSNYCAPLNVIQFNASTSSFDGDQLGGFSDLSSTALSTFTDAVGVGEGVTDAGEYFVGTIPGDQDKSCSPKDLDALSDASGLCPEGPWLEGTYGIAGLAYFANQNSIRSDLTDVTGGTADVRVKTFGVSLSPAQPVIRVPVPGSTGKEVVILPACMEFRTDASAPGGRRHNGNCAIVDFRIVEPHNPTTGEGKFLVLWESAQFGGDYDQDMAGIIKYKVTSSSIAVTTQVYTASTGGIHGFGYVISGTTKDGLHIHSGHNGFSNYADPYGLLDCSSGCNSGDAATTQAYALGTTTAKTLNTPLFYAAKWGGFHEEADSENRPTGAAAPNQVPDQDYEWDANGDGLPDNYFYSTNPSQLATSLEKVFLAITEQLASAASTAANSQRAETGTYVYQARFNSKDWSSELLKYSIDLTTGALTLDTSTWGSSGDAAVLLDSQTSRQIITYDNANSNGIAFTWSALQSASLDSLLSIDPDTGLTDSRGQGRLDFIRGVRTQELQNGGPFRDRARVLGDIVSSSPVFVGSPGFNYPDYLESGETYSAFKTRVASRPNMLWVGANDGMLHGFDADSGVERLAYVPGSLIADLPKLTSQNYTHRYFVDGSPSVGDVFYSGTWHTVLVGGLNAGGRAIYALDVTTPGASFSEGNAANVALWEITPSSTGFADLGYTFSRPAIVKNNDGAWVAVFGNGYASASGKAVLYIANIQTGALIGSVEVDSTGNNGLSTVAPVDINGDQVIDAIYAGDLKGNVWKFIPSSTNSSTWTSAFKAGSTPIPFFTAPADASGYVQPITSRIEVGKHPEGKPGVMVYFGTGKYLENGDNLAGSDVQRFYGIWDLFDKGGTTSIPNSDSPPSSPSISLTNLLQQCVTIGDYGDTCVANAASSTGETLEDYNVRYVSNNDLANWHWNSATGYMGWYIDLPQLGEMSVSDPTLRGGRIIFNTIVPSDHSCSDGGTSWLMELDAANGSRLEVPVFDVNGDGVFDTQDTKSVTDGTNSAQIAPSGQGNKIGEDSGITTRPTILMGPDGRREFKYSSSSSGDVKLTVENPIPFDEGRKSWLQLK